MQPPIPEGFDSYIRQLIESNFKDIRISVSLDMAHTIYNYYLSGESCDKLRRQIEQITRQEESRRQIQQLLQRDSQMMRLFFQKFDVVIPDTQDFDDDDIQKDKLALFSQKDFLNDELFEKILENSHGLIFHKGNNFWNKLKDHMDVCQDDYRQTVAKLLISQSQYSDFEPNEQEQILNKFIERKEKYHEAIEILMPFNLNEQQSTLYELFQFNRQQKSEENKFQETNASQRVESFQDFQLRVQKLIGNHSLKWKKMKKSIVKQVLEQLYAQRNELDRQQIFIILSNARIFKQDKQITFQLIKQIYQIQENVRFKNSQYKNVIQHPDIQFSPISKADETKDQQFFRSPNVNTKSSHKPTIQRQEEYQCNYINYELEPKESVKQYSLTKRISEQRQQKRIPSPFNQPIYEGPLLSPINKIVVEQEGIQEQSSFNTLFSNKRNSLNNSNIDYQQTVQEQIPSRFSGMRRQNLIRPQRQQFLQDQNNEYQPDLRYMDNFQQQQFAGQQSYSNKFYNRNQKRQDSYYQQRDLSFNNGNPQHESAEYLYQSTYIPPQRMNSSRRLNTERLRQSQTNLQNPGLEQSSFFSNGSGSKKSEKEKKEIEKNNELNQINRLNRELQSIKKSTKNVNSVQRMTRQLQLSITKQIETNIKQKCQELKQMIKRYNIECSLNLTEQLQSLQLQSIQKQQKISKIESIRRSIEGVNLEQIIESKRQIQLNKECQSASAIIIVGQTGVGKSTLLVGLSGFPLALDKQSGDYQAADNAIKQKYKISNSTQSVTRWANVSKVNKQWAGIKEFYNQKDERLYVQNKTLLIDTAGLEDNRVIEVDITNNIGTVKLLQTLGKGRFVIAISKNSFKDRWYSDFKRIIKSLAKFFININTLSQSITFVLTKGLEKDKLVSQFKAFKVCETFKSQNWNPNQALLISLMTQKFNSLPKENEIKDPANHNYHSLALSILNLSQIQMPGSYIYTSFSTESRAGLDKAVAYNKLMVAKSFEQQQPILTKFYLERLLALDDIYKQKEQFQNSIQSIFQKIKENIDNYEQLIQQYLKYGSEKVLESIITIYNKFKAQQAIHLCQMVYRHLENQQQTPINALNRFIQQLVQSMEQKVQQFSIQQLLKVKEQLNDIGIEKLMMKELAYKMNLIQKLHSTKKYQQILSKIENQKRKIKNKMKESLQKQEFDEQQWQENVIIFKHQIEIDIDCIEKQNYKVLQVKQIVKDYLSTFSSQKNKLDQFLIHARTLKFDGTLEKNYAKYIKKLEVLKYTDINIKQIIQPELNHIVKILLEQSAYYQTKLNQWLRNPFKTPISQFKINEFNRREIYRILFTLNESTFSKFKFQRQQDIMYQKLEQNFQNASKDLGNKIQDLLQNFTKSKYNQILNNIHQTLSVLEVIKAQMLIDSQAKVGISNIRPTSAKYIKQTVKKTQEILQKIIIDLNKKCLRFKVNLSSINEKLVITYALINLLKKYTFHFDNQERTKMISAFSKSIKDTMLKPLNYQFAFVKSPDFQAFYLHLKYVKNLEQQLFELDVDMTQFQNIFPIDNNSKFKKTLKSCFFHIEKLYQHFQGMIDHIKQKQLRNENNSFIFHYDGSQQKGINNQDNDMNGTQKNSEDKTILKKSSIQDEKQKQRIKNQQFYTKSMSNKAIDYILAFQKVRELIDQFKDQIIIFDCDYKKILQLDLEKFILEALKSICSEVDKISSPTNQKHTTLEQLYQYSKEINFFWSIIKKIRPLRDNDSIKQTCELLNSLIKDYKKKFEDIYNVCVSLYSLPENAVDFEQLKTLLNHSCSKQEDKKRQIETLLIGIDKRYSKLMPRLSAQSIQDNSILLIMAQFYTILKQFQFQFTIKFNYTSFKKKCTQYFQQLYFKYDEIIANLKKGIIISDRQIQQIIYQQEKILQWMPEIYEEYKKTKFPQEQKVLNIKDLIINVTKKIQNDFEQKYMKNHQTEYQVDQVFNSYYTNTSDTNKQKMMKKYSDRCNKKFVQMWLLMKTDHDKLQKLIKTFEDEVLNIPQDLEVCVSDQLKKIKTQYQKISSELINKIRNSLYQKNLQQIISGIEISYKFQNSEAKKYALEQLEIYYRNQEQSFQINDPEKFEKKLQAYFKIIKGQQYQKICFQIPQLRNAYEKYLLNIKQKLKEKAQQQLIQNLKNYQDRLKKLNRHQNFNVGTFKSQDCSIPMISVQILRILRKFSEYFSQQYSQLVKKLQQHMLSLKQSIVQQMQKMNNQYLKPLKQGRFINIQQQVLAQFPRAIQQLCIFKEKCIILNELSKTDHFKEEIQLKNVISQCKKFFSQIHSALQEKHDNYQKWNFLQEVNGNLEKTILQNFQKVQKDILIIEKFEYIISCKQKTTTFGTDFVENNYKKLKQFQQNVISEIDSCFKQPDRVKGQKILKFYFLQKLLKTHKLKILPPNSLGSQTIKNTLIKKFEQLIQKINQFATNKQIKNEFKSLIDQQIQITNEQTTSIKNKKKQCQDKAQQFKEKHLKNFQLKIKGITEIDPEKKAQQMERLRKNSQTDLIAKIRDFQTQYDNHVIQQRKIAQRKRLRVLNSMKTIINILIKNLIIFIHATTYFSCEQKIVQIAPKLHELIKHIEKNYSKKFTLHLYNCLNEHESSYSFDIMECQAFKSYRATKFIQDTKGQNFSKLISTIPLISSDENMRISLENQYKQFEKIYNSVLDSHRNSLNRQSIQNGIVSEAHYVGQQLSKAYENNSGRKQDIVRLLANIFALWSIIESDIDEGQDVVIYAYKPHAGQVLSIFLLLGLDKPVFPGKIDKRIIQIQTGQGKSIVLGGLSAYLGLIGFEVYEACYSQYLSKRDLEAFTKLFNKFQIGNKVKYDIFPQICKMLLDWDEKQSFCKKVERFIQEQRKNIPGKIFTNFFNFFKGTKNTQTANQELSKKILLIDEADVFLNQNYIGQSYRPSIRYSTRNVQSLFRYLWNQRDHAQSLDPETVYSSQQYKAVIKQFNNEIFTKIIKNQVHGMIRDLVNYKNDVYSLVDRRIHYKEGDGLSDKIRYGYRTAFSYLHEYQIKNQIHFSDVAPHLAFHFIVASFSYSLLPGYFQSILGVTGTLESMSFSQKRILNERFKVNFYVQPSIYQKSRRKIIFKKCSTSQLNSLIVKSIDEQYNKRRPILVFFKTKQEVYSFFESKQFVNYKNQASLVTYEVDNKTRDFRINVSTEQSNITLLTIDFARGTDFKVKAKNKETHQGLHVISASLPSTYSDYIQLIGRTGRQGRRGTALIFIPDDSSNLKEQQITDCQGEQIIRKNEDWYWRMKSVQIERKMNSADGQHKRSLQIYNEKPSIKTLLDTIYKLNQEIPIAKYKSKTVICLDGTGSMSAIFEKVKQVISGAIPDIYSAIKQSNVRAEFEIKLLVYRNYNSNHSALLQQSNFETKEEPLLKWLKGIKVSGGAGNEAIQVCLQSINKQKDINQFVIIADAPANDQKETISKRSQYHSQGDTYWTNHNFPMTTYERELQILSHKNVKGHSYYIGSHLASFFNRLSKQTKGSSEEFIVNHPEATKRFAKFVADRILQHVGEMIGGNAAQVLIHNYDKIASKKKYV